MRNITEGEVPLIPTALGCWWGNDPVKKEQAEVDIVITGIDGELILGECKWHNSLIDLGVLETLAIEHLFSQNQKSPLQQSFPLNYFQIVVFKRTYRTKHFFIGLCCFFSRIFNRREL